MLDRAMDRRAALIASAIALPITVALAFLLNAGTGASSGAGGTAPVLPAVTVPAPPLPDVATRDACLAVFERLPIELDSLAPRRLDTDSSFVGAWGDPAVVLRCGVPRPVLDDPARPPALREVNEVIYALDDADQPKTFTVIDRSVGIDIMIPRHYQAGDVLPRITAAISALPAICTASSSLGPAKPGLPVCGS
jgi:hypothetical protein